MQYGYIYITTNTVNGKKYIGMCSDEDRFYNYFGSGTIITQAIDKYGKENFTNEIIAWYDDDTSLQQAEIDLIAKHDAVNSPDFYNLHPGGRGGDLSKFVDRDKLSRSIKAQWATLTSEERKARMGHIGKWDKFGSNNPTALKVRIVDENGEHFFDCLKDYANKVNMPYPSLKGLFNRFRKNPDYKHKHNSKYKHITLIEVVDA